MKFQTWEGLFFHVVVRNRWWWWWILLFSFLKTLYPITWTLLDIATMSFDMLLKWSEGNANDKISPVWFCRIFTFWITFRSSCKEKSLMISLYSLFGKVKKNHTVKLANVLGQKGKKNRTNHRKCGVTDVEWPVTVYKYYPLFIFHLMLQNTVPKEVMEESWFQVCARLIDSLSVPLQISVVTSLISRHIYFEKKMN